MRIHCHQENEQLEEALRELFGQARAAARFARLYVHAKNRKSLTPVLDSAARIDASEQLDKADAALRAGLRAAVAALDYRAPPRPAEPSRAQVAAAARWHWQQKEAERTHRAREALMKQLKEKELELKRAERSRRRIP